MRDANRAPRWPLAALLVLLFPTAANAHVKWFCAYDVAGQPRGLEQVLCAQFEWLTAIALIALTLGTLIERTEVGRLSTIGLNWLTQWPRENTERLVRGVCGAFFVALWTMGGVILTPELKTTAEWIPWFQLAMAACFLWRQTLPLAGLGIYVLFGIGVHDYGVFHLADYPVFLGVGTFLILTGFGWSFFGIRPLDFLRFTAAVTLMWASVEKWAYPQWTDPLLAQKPEMTMGFSGDLFMDAAGVIEFTLAFALIWTPLVRRVSAVILTAVFISAIFEFGKIDAIGHSGIIAVLIAIAADDARVAATRRDVVLAPLYYASALMTFLGIYYVAHTMLYGELYGLAAGAGATLPVI